MEEGWLPRMVVVVVGEPFEAMGKGVVVGVEEVPVGDTWQMVVVVVRRYWAMMQDWYSSFQYWKPRDARIVVLPVAAAAVAAAIPVAVLPLPP